MRNKKQFYVFTVLIIFCAGCNGSNSDGTPKAEKESVSVVHEDHSLSSENKAIHVKKETVENISSFDIEFVQKVLAQENFSFKADSYTLEKAFLLTNIKKTEDGNSYLEVFVYEVSFHDKKEPCKELSEKLKHQSYIKNYPETKALHTCFMFMDDERFFIIGYFGSASGYEPFDIDFFISYVKESVQ